MLALRNSPLVRRSMSIGLRSLSDMKLESAQSHLKTFKIYRWVSLGAAQRRGAEGCGEPRVDLTRPPPAPLSPPRARNPRRNRAPRRTRRRSRRRT